jgi:prepilin-type processing-associated H-X9-DG protein
MLPALSQAKSKAQTIMCVNQLKQQALAVHMYADDNNGVLPAGAKWCDALKPYLGGSVSVFRCPLDRPDTKCSYAFNARLSGLKLDKVNHGTVVLFESSGGWNAVGGSEQMTSRHGGTFVVAFADGSVQQYHGDPRELRWDP